jgi:hypothetical protein
VLDDHREIPGWIDGVLEKAVHPDPDRRYESLSEFVYDLRHPNKVFLKSTGRALLERHPVLFWKSMSLVLALLLFALFFVHYAIP